MDLGFAIKNIRTSRGLSQKKLADLCGISRTYLSLVETNTNEPSMSTLKILAQELSIPLPILVFQSLDKNDIREDLRDSFDLIADPLHSLIDELFTEANKHDEN